MGKITHFGVSILQNEKNQLKRENYALIDKRPSLGQGEREKYKRLYQKHPEVYSKCFENELCELYTDEWCENHRANCLKNFDINMAYMDALDKKELDDEIRKLLLKHREIQQVVDLNACENLSGVYIMVLDYYKQIYIGQSSNVKKRIMSHWSKKKSFDRLIFGQVEESVLSIDVFGALDTTRIYVFPSINALEVEEVIVEE